MATPEEKMERVYKVLRLYAEKGASLPNQSTLARIAGLSGGVAVKVYIRKLHNAERLQFYRHKGYISIIFPDGAQTAPRDICVARARKLERTQAEQAARTCHD